MEKVTLDITEFVEEMINDPDVPEALRQRISTYYDKIKAQNEAERSEITNKEK